MGRFAIEPFCMYTNYGPKMACLTGKLSVTKTGTWDKELLFFLNKSCNYSINFFQLLDGDSCVVVGITKSTFMLPPGHFKILCETYNDESIKGW